MVRAREGERGARGALHHAPGALHPARPHAVAHRHHHVLAANARQIVSINGERFLQIGVGAISYTAGPMPLIKAGVGVTAFFCFMFSWVELLLARTLTTHSRLFSRRSARGPAAPSGPHSVGAAARKSVRL